MAKQPAKNANITISVALEDDIDNFTLNINQETPVVTCLSDAGPRRVAGNYDWNLDVSGGADFADAQSDSTLFGMLGSAGVTVAVEPTGEAADADNPHYDSASGGVLGSYSISSAVGGRIDFSASILGTAALSRDVGA